MMERYIKHKSPLLKVILFVLLPLAILGFGGYSYYRLNTDFKNTVKEFEGKVSDLESRLANSRGENEQLIMRLNGEVERNNAFESQIEEISGTVGTLTKLSQTDEELLQKYSKVYFLNENYIPSDLTEIDKEYLYNEDNSFQIHTGVRSFLENLLKDAIEDGIDLRVISAYRSFSTQAGLKSSYKVTYGFGANQFSADQGYSEHQLGTAIDFTTIQTGANFSAFEKAAAYKWLTDNAFKYGFILSYPKGNEYYQFEPWHWRFVGVSLAKMLNKEALNFYDVDQREIDKYLVNIFD
jgi:LAS superfamily LD-carboxypeptidase LdcB